MDIRVFLKVVRRRWLVVVATLMAALGVAAIGSYLTTPVYSATATIRIAQAQTGTVQYSDYMYVDRLVNTYARIAVSNRMLDQVIQKLSLDTTPLKLAKSIEVKPIQDTELVAISAESTSATQAVTLAQTLADLVVQENDDLYLGGVKSAYEIVGEQLRSVSDNLTAKRTQLQTLQAAPNPDADRVAILTADVAALEQSYASLLRQYEDMRTTEAIRTNSISLVESATLPEAPVKPSWPLNLAMALFAGLLGGVGLAHVVNTLDRTVRDSEEVSRELSLPVLGAVPHMPGPKGQRVLIPMNNGQLTPATEAYRFIRANLHAMGLAESLKTLVVTSAMSGDGKSTFSANLAVSMARSGLRVIVVDCDVWHPTIGRMFALGNPEGLADWLSNQAQLVKVMQPTPLPTLRVISAGQVDRFPCEGLKAEQMAQLVASLRDSADVVVFDTPPVLETADGAVMAPLVDGIILVVGQGRVLTDRVKSAMEQIQLVRGNLLGMVMNMADLTERSYRYYARARQA